MTRKSGKYFHVTYGTLDSCFDLLRSPPLEIEPATTTSRAETLQSDQRSTLHTSDAKLTSHSKRRRPFGIVGYSMPIPLYTYISNIYD